MAFILLVMAVFRCANLPGSMPRPISQALTDITTTILTKISTAYTPEDKRELSGFRLLPTGAQTFDSHITLSRLSENTLDPRTT